MGAHRSKKSEREMVFPLGMFYAGYEAQKWPEMLDFCRESHPLSPEPWGRVVGWRQRCSDWNSCLQMPQGAPGTSGASIAGRRNLKVLPRTHLGQKEWICGSLCKTRMRNKAASWGIHGLCSVTYFIRAGGKTIWPQFQTPPFVSLACVLWSLPQGLCHCLTSMLQIPSDSPG